MKQISQIKHLQVSITKLQGEIANLTYDAKRINEDIGSKKAQIQSIQERLTHLQKESGDVMLSEHAIIRYLQRVYRLDLEKLSSEILTKELKSTILSLGNGTYAQGEYRVKVIDNTIVTILEAEHPHQKSSRAKRNKPLTQKQLNKVINEELADVV